MASPSKSAKSAGPRAVATNRQARRDYEIIDTYEAVRRNDLAEARKQFFRWAEFRAFARRAGQPSAAKRAIDLLGRRGGPVRRPLVDITAEQMTELAGVLKRMGLDVRG